MQLHKGTTLVILLGLSALFAVFGVIEFDLSGRPDRNLDAPSHLKIQDKTQNTRVSNGAKPLLILHVGPRKTATTSIQRFAKEHREQLQQDNVYFLGNGRFPGGFFTHELVRTCRTEKKTNCTMVWKEFETLLDSHHAQNHTVIVSEENFSAFANKRLENERLWHYLIPVTEKWNVRVIYTYRRQYELISSLYYQIHDPTTKNIWKKQSFENWPTSGGLEIPRFPDYVAQQENATFVDPPEVKKRWEAVFGNVRLINFHSGKELLQVFFCDMVPETPLICQLLKAKGLSVIENSASSKNLHFDMIAVEAHKRGYVNDSLSRKAVAKAIEDHAIELGMEKLTDFPVDHLPASQAAALLTHSLLIESEMVPEFHLSPEGKVAHVEGFLRYIETGRLASVDTDAVLKDPRWTEFFKELY